VSIPRFYPILDTSMVADPVATAHAILDGGARILQFRHKAAFTRSMFEGARQIAELCRAAGAAFILNDRADVALMLASRCGAGFQPVPMGLPPAKTHENQRGATSQVAAGSQTAWSTQLEMAGWEPAARRGPAPQFLLCPVFDCAADLSASGRPKGRWAENPPHIGLHLGQTDLAPSDARRIMGDAALIGFSTHNEAQLRDAASDPVVGLAELRRLRRLTSKPLVAIGGITRGNALSVFDAGADSVAVIGDLLAGCASAADIRRRTEEWLRLTSKPARVS